VCIDYVVLPLERVGVGVPFTRLLLRTPVYLLRGQVEAEFDEENSELASTPACLMSLRPHQRGIRAVQSLTVLIRSSRPISPRARALRWMWQAGCTAVDAPVSGGDAGARNATLAIMAGGDVDAVARLAPLFQCMGTVTHLGPAGCGQSCKIANQVTIATTMVGLVEGAFFEFSKPVLPSLTALSLQRVLLSSKPRSRWCC
jgi:hypothetical protein